ncbi:hypothetical protein [Bacillus manliponensis]|uniref:hypothetical protein n=1 Tax=Bacillus manliponensis TaxID=574376 RepID=UPI00068C7607|nr:hypothetical protein [Bacillus manliponensis]
MGTIGIDKHHARNAKGSFFIFMIILLIGMSMVLYEYSQTSSYKWREDYISILNIFMLAVMFLIVSIIERSRAKKMEQIQTKVKLHELLDQRRFVVRKEMGMLTQITYFAMDGNVMGMLKERYGSPVQKLWKMLVSFFIKGWNSQQFVLYDGGQNELLNIKKQAGLNLCYKFYNENEEYIGCFKQTWEIKKIEWLSLSSINEEIGRITGDLSANIQTGKWRDGSYIDVKEDAIPLDAVEYFSASGGSLVNLVVMEECKEKRAMYYAIAAILTFQK